MRKTFDVKLVQPRPETQAIRNRDEKGLNTPHDTARLVKHRDELLQRFHEQRVALTRHGALDGKLTQIAYDMRRVMPRDGGKEKAAAQLESLFEILFRHPVMKKQPIVRSEVGHHINPLLDKIHSLLQNMDDQTGIQGKRNKVRLSDGLVKIQQIVQSAVRDAERRAAPASASSNQVQALNRPRFIPPQLEDINRKLAAD